MQLVQNVIIVTLCVDSRHTFFFITFCVNGIRSVSNDKQFVSCYDRWHNYSIVLIFDELLIFFSILPLDFACLLSTDEVRGIYFCVVRASVSHSVHPSALLSVRNHISVLICHIRIILRTNDMYHVLSMSYKFRQTDP